MSDEPKRLPKLYIRERIEAAKVGQRQIAERIGTTEATVSRLLSGQRKMTLEWLTAFADALKVEPYDLFKDPRDAISGDREILEMLNRIEGLSERGVELAFMAITMTMGTSAAISPQPSADDLSKSSTPHRERQSSR